jgi:hypothetical protein
MFRKAAKSGQVELMQLVVRTRSCKCTSLASTANLGSGVSLHDRSPHTDEVLKVAERQYPDFDWVGAPAHRREERPRTLAYLTFSGVSLARAL